MKRSRENLSAHELVGLDVRVLDAPDPTLVGLEGNVVFETLKTLHIMSGSRVTVLPKRGAKLLFTLESGEQTILEGNRILIRPEDRLSV